MAINGNEYPVTRKICVKARMSFATPALLGSGEGENTDNDIIRDGSGNVFLPGSSVAGVLRELLPPKDKEALFGNKDKTMSPMWVLDTELPDAVVIALDGVALDERDRFNKIAKPTSKYDFECVDAGLEFDLRLMLVERTNNHAVKPLFDNVLSALQQGKVRFGGKTNRGFGELKCVSLTGVTYSKAEGTLKNWLDFDWRQPLKPYTPETKYIDTKFDTLTAKLKLDGSIMVRDFKSLKDKEQYAHLTANGMPVIFGTSWAGCFRSWLLKWVPNDASLINEMFGYMDKKTTKPSQIKFLSSYLTATDSAVDGWRTVVRVKIDRFTGGASDGALFTSRPWFGGETELRILYPKNKPQYARLLNVAIEALKKGMLTIGGETSIGRGVFKEATK